MVLGILFTAELIAISFALNVLDGRALHTGVIDAVREFLRLPVAVQNWDVWITRGLIAFAAIFVTFGFLRNKMAFQRISRDLESASLRRLVLVAHLGALGSFAYLSSVVYAGDNSWKHPELLAGIWLVAGLTTVCFGALAFIPFPVWRQLLSIDPPLWGFAATGATAFCVLGKASHWAWHSLALVTLTLTKTLLTPFVPAVITKPADWIIGTKRFYVIIDPPCSGLEGIGLILIFTIMWLAVFRRECRFPQSLVLIPAVVVASFFLNSLRIAALILIGNAGAPQIAIGGFHSQAGWILFNLVAVGFCIAVCKVPWFRKTRPVADALPHSFDNPTAAYLIPLLAIFAAGMLAIAASGNFDWLYPLRLIAGGAALWFYRQWYRGLNWSFSWVAPLAGMAVCATWVVVNGFADGNSKSGMPATLIYAASLARWAWIGLRLVAAVVTVPIAEELAFRGFLLRRLLSTDFEAVPFGRVTFFAVIVSSVIFGILHGGHWFAGTVAGIVFALLVRRSGRIGDAVVAHATANGLLAAYVLLSGNWHLW